MADININQLTNVNLEGVFDILSKTVHERLQDEFKAGRITGTEYSKVYVTALDNTLAQSIQFLLQKDISANQAELLDAQRLLAVAQEAAVRADIILTNAQVEKVEREIILMDKQEDLMDAQIALTQGQVEKMDKEIELLEVEKSKTTQEVLLVTAQTAVANKNVEVLTAQALNLPKEGVLLDKQALKTVEETTFLSQRIKTEKAQILDTVDGVPVTGILGKQRLLYQAQTDGFTRDAEYKIMTKLIDTWNVRRGTDDGTVADGVNKLSDGNIGAVVSKAMAGINVTPV